MTREKAIIQYVEQQYRKLAAPVGELTPEGRGYLVGMGDVLRFVDSLPKKEELQGLDEVAEEYSLPKEEPIIPYTKADIKQAFKAGAQWQKEQMNSLALFKELPHIDCDKLVVQDNLGYVPTLYFYDGSWFVDWVHCEDGDSLVGFPGDTPVEAIQKAYRFYKEEIILPDSSN